MDWNTLLDPYAVFWWRCIRYRWLRHVPGQFILFFLFLRLPCFLPETFVQSLLYQLQNWIITHGIKHPQIHTDVREWMNKWIHKWINTGEERTALSYGSEVAQSRPTLFDLMDSSLPGSSVHGTSRQEYWSGLPFPSSYTRIPINKCRRNEGNRGSPLEHHSNNHGSQHPLMDGKISGRSLRKHVFTLSKRYLLTTKRKIITEQWKNMADTILSKWLSCISQEEDVNIRYP